MSEKAKTLQQLSSVLGKRAINNPGPILLLADAEAHEAAAVREEREYWLQCIEEAAGRYGFDTGGLCGGPLVEELAGALHEVAADVRQQARREERARCAAAARELQEANQVEVVDTYDRGYSNACGDAIAAIEALGDEPSESPADQPTSENQ